MNAQRTEIDLLTNGNAGHALAGAIVVTKQ